MKKKTSKEYHSNVKLILEDATMSALRAKAKSIDLDLTTTTILLLVKQIESGQYSLPKKENKKTDVTVRLGEALIKKIKEISDKNEVPVTALIRHWLETSLESE